MVTGNHPTHQFCDHNHTFSFWHKNSQVIATAVIGPSTREARIQRPWESPHFQFKNRPTFKISTKIDLFSMIEPIGSIPNIYLRKNEHCHSFGSNAYIRYPSMGKNRSSLKVDQNRPGRIGRIDRFDVEYRFSGKHEHNLLILRTLKLPFCKGSPKL